MVLLLIRGDSYEKIKNALADVHRHAKLTIVGKPRIMVPEAADEILEYIVGNIKKPCKKACLVKIEENAPRSIDRIRKIHPPAHIVILSERHEPYSFLIDDFPKMPMLKGYYKSKAILDNEDEENGKKSEKSEKNTKSKQKNKGNKK
ncbi:DUF356 domain-containing protein [Methanococcus voltae]|uniref:DUF356 domain-containing protein n=2 Tax=Methanococcus voltae TaxID=2188 RepID=A0A8J7URM6_METVO|nr:DUF356 domain-containing protein [Methanococcus voltae]MBP2172257.1 hypothetical protein [Methanococcus voltae]MBP2200787.1 hypothetical protein [Methanococcus voltae]MCS3921511.1 hypothetical protein [Methanococcus voltae PS]